MIAEKTDLTLRETTTAEGLFIIDHEMTAIDDLRVAVHQHLDRLNHLFGVFKHAEAKGHAAVLEITMEFNWRRNFPRCQVFRQKPSGETGTNSRQTSKNNRDFWKAEPTLPLADDHSRQKADGNTTDNNQEIPLPERPSKVSLERALTNLANRNCDPGIARIMQHSIGLCGSCVISAVATNLGKCEPCETDRHPSVLF